MGQCRVEVWGDIGEEGWTALASGLQRHPGFTTVEASRETMLQAPRAALKIICDAMGGLGTRSEWWVETDRVVTVFKDGVTEEGDELKWEELQEILECLFIYFESQVQSQEGEGDGEAGEEDEQI